jgi:hypothetical protein
MERGGGGLEFFFFNMVGFWAWIGGGGGVGMVLDLFFKLVGAWAWMGVSFYTSFPLFFQKSRTLG